MILLVIFLENGPEEFPDKNLFETVDIGLSFKNSEKREQVIRGRY
ncbi:hypothetical protein B488_04030 [Liberibacter crescens BT-1]|uniref:Uncharacterized protein n=1 Tax=Liberibacter crescens (strain BT-1) TaxID=1215343 RepID=L0EU64_LIBCB|nr:hypothetical protein B488_04030 [Liberibacter crescens BT-1]